MLALIDGDIIVHRVAWTTQTDPEGIARYRCDEMVEGILRDLEADTYRVFLSDLREYNFRTNLWAGYKANRTQPRPKHYDYLKEYVIAEWDARIAYGMEADDALGINQDKAIINLKSGSTVICSIDKDLLQIPGSHWNFVKKEAREVLKSDADRSFYTSILVGDATDNIKGCRGIGPVKAKEALKDCAIEEEYVKTIIEVYKKQEEDKSTEEILDHIKLAGALLKIKQKEDEPVWDSPFLKVSPEPL